MQALTSWPGLDSEFYLVERKLADRGLLRLPNELLSAWLRRAMRDPALADVNPRLLSLLRLHYRYRFDPHSLSPADRETLRRGAEQALAAIAQPRGR